MFIDPQQNDQTKGKRYNSFTKTMQNTLKEIHKVLFREKQNK